MNVFFKTALATLVFIVVMLAFYYVHIRYFKVNVVFYASLLDGMLAAALVGLLFWVFRFSAISLHWKWFSYW